MRAPRPRTRESAHDQLRTKCLAAATRCPGGRMRNRARSDEQAEQRTEQQREPTRETRKEPDKRERERDDDDKSRRVRVPKIQYRFLKQLEEKGVSTTARGDALKMVEKIRKFPLDER